MKKPQDRRSSLSEHALFVSWVNKRGRSAGLANRLGIENWQASGGSYSPVSRYLRLTVATWQALNLRRPHAIIVMQPPIFALVVVELWARLNRARVAGDLHTGTFTNPKWRWATGLVLRLLRSRSNVAIVTNARLAEIVYKRGGRVIVTDDAIEVHEFQETPGGDLDYILVPLAYAPDEPITALLEAIRSLPSFSFILTGNAPESVLRDARNLSNITFSGMVSDAEYVELLVNSRMVVALTTKENTMQRAGYEAMYASKALVTSHTAVLRSYFGAAAIYCNPDPTSIASAVVEASSTREKLSRLITALRISKLTEETRQIEALRDWISFA